MLKDKDHEVLTKFIQDDWMNFDEEMSIDNNEIKERIYDNVLDTLIKQKARRARINNILKIAAVIVLPILISVVTFFVMQSHEYYSLYSTVTTGTGEKSIVTLPDGSKIFLNESSGLCYNAGSFMGNDERIIDYTGEGYFEISKQKGVNMIVHTQYVDIKITGTSFSVKSLKDAKNAEINLYEGSVSLYALNSGKTIDLKAGERVVYHADTKRFDISTIDSNDNNLGWNSDSLQFKNASLASVISQLNEHYGSSLNITTDIKNERFTGSLPTNDLQLAISILEKSFSIQITTK